MLPVDPAAGPNMCITCETGNPLLPPALAPVPSQGTCYVLRVPEDLASHLTSGATLEGRYTLDHLLGRGGMASVWLALDLRYDRRLAIKTLDPELAGAVGADRFLREVRVTSRLNHTGVLPILDSGVVRTIDGVAIPWYAMPYVEGESLRARLSRETQLPVDEALRIATAVGSVLDTAHRAHIVHRDVKPENVLLSGENVYVVDFGIAKALADTQSERLTSTGLAVGTPAYMSPEQASAEPVDARSDQYSLASILYEMLAGEPPFTGPTTAAVIARRLTERPRALTTVRATVPRSVEQATFRALERTPADRFATISDFVAALRGHATPSTGRNMSSKRPATIVMAAVAIVVLGASAWAAARYLAIGRSAARDPALVALYQRGVHEYDRRTTTGNDESIAIFRSVLARDSTRADAWNFLAKSYIRAWTRGYRVPGVARNQIIPLAVTAVDRSLALDSTNADAWATLGLVRRSLDPTDVDPAVRALRRSVAMDSTNGTAWQYLGIEEAELGNFDAALRAWRTGARVAPAYAEGLAFLALGHYWRRNMDSAAFWADSAARLEPSYAFARTVVGQVATARRDLARGEAAFEAAARLTSDVEYLNGRALEARLYAVTGHPDRARAVIRDADSIRLRLNPLPSHPAVNLAEAYLGLGERNRAMKLLRDVQPRRDLHFQLHLRCDPTLDSLRTDPAFRALLLHESPPAGKGC
jgi:serine/threonine protein kinase